MRVSVPAVHVPSEHFRTMTRLFPVHFFQNVFLHLCDAKLHLLREPLRTV